MIKQLATWQLIHDSLQKHLSVMLLYVLESNGSSPGRQGFLMAVNSLGQMAGSIGGGMMEYKLVELAKEKLRQGARHESSIRTQYHDKEAAHNQSGMICSGDQTVWLYYVHPTEADSVQAIIECLVQRNNGLLELSPSGIQFSADILPEDTYRFMRESEDEWLYWERLGYKNQLFIVGGGHCALALSRLMNQMDFYVRVFDDRPDLHTMGLNEAAQEKIVVKQYDELAQLIPSGSNHYVVIMTFGFRTDDVALRALLNKQVRYIGLLGSKAKIGKMFTQYRDEGIAEEQLQWVHAPVGMAINSQTPEEIAVSIAAEIIRVKNER
ncbi:XdhC family protein [Spirosoma sp. BT702]|uniref:XdhC family protein n=1 Tax=Spirosoma profusum TaxID=2771354 RepID=A0A926Y0L6_9BACT|nr:XdhC/CoxI family protein [Spirosoma profusum]MBD2704394.1 XdhC family protein [Spirosoma profusum]